MLLDPATRRAELQRRFPAWVEMTLAQALDRATEDFADRPLMINEQGEFSYAEVQAMSRRFASGLVAWGLKPGEHVALILANFIEFAALRFALARVAAVAIPVNFHLRGAELEYVLNQSDAVAVIAMHQLRDHDYLRDLSGLALPRVREIFALPTSKEPLALRTVEQLAGLGTAESEMEVTKRERSADPRGISEILYTSGTTGEPKGVLIRHDAVLRAGFASAYHRAFEDGRRIAHALPMYHVFGYVECLIAATFVGGAVISHMIFDPDALLDSIERHKATDLIALPNMTLKLLERARARDFESEHLVAVFNSGGVNPPEIWNEIRALLRPVELVTGYGMTETTASTTCTLPEDDDAKLLGSNGRFKLAGAAGDASADGFTAIYKAIDPETGKDLRPGENGELVVQGPIVTHGYYNKPRETAEAFTPDQWLHTGDLGTVDAEHYLTLTGRIKESYRCGGEMVMPREIEALVETHPLVEQALAVGIADPRMGEIGCLCVVAARDQLPEPQALIDMCSARLARFKVPRHVLFFTADEIPVTATGRPQKIKLREIAKMRLASPESIR